VKPPTAEQILRRTRDLVAGKAERDIFQAISAASVELRRENQLVQREFFMRMAVVSMLSEAAGVIELSEHWRALTLEQRLALIDRAINLAAHYESSQS
jgi:hypothetical protein